MSLEIGDPWEGLEPSTSDLESRCSTAELPTEYKRTDVPGADAKTLSLDQWVALMYKPQKWQGSISDRNEDLPHTYCFVFFLPALAFLLPGTAGRKPSFRSIRSIWGTK